MTNLPYYIYSRRWGILRFPRAGIQAALRSFAAQFQVSSALHDLPPSRFCMLPGFFLLRDSRRCSRRFSASCQARRCPLSPRYRYLRRHSRSVRGFGGSIYIAYIPLRLPCRLVWCNVPCICSLRVCIRSVRRRCSRWAKLYLYCSLPRCVYHRLLSRVGWVFPVQMQSPHPRQSWEIQSCLISRYRLRCSLCRFRFSGFFV